MRGSRLSLVCSTSMRGATGEKEPGRARREAARSDREAEGSQGGGHFAGELIALEWHCERRACAEVEARRMCRAAHSRRGRMMEDANSALHSVWSQPPPTTSGATRGIPKWHSLRVILTLLAIADISHRSRPRICKRLEIGDIRRHIPINCLRRNQYRFF